MEQLVENRSATEKNMHKNNKHVVGAAQQRSKIDFSSYPRPAGIATHFTFQHNKGLVCYGTGRYVRTYQITTTTIFYLQSTTHSLFLSLL